MTGDQRSEVRDRRSEVACPTCRGEGFIDAGPDAHACADCDGSGSTRALPIWPWHRQHYDRAELEMLRQALALLHDAKPINRRLGRPASGREIIALAHKLGLSFGGRHQRSEVGSRRSEVEELPTDLRPLTSDIRPLTSDL